MNTITQDQFDDFVLPLLLHSPQEFNRKQTEQKVERLMQLLGSQAFWLSVQQFFEQHPHVKALQMLPKNKTPHSVSTDHMMLPIYHNDATKVQMDKTNTLAKRYFQTARGKFAHWRGYDWFVYLDSIVNTDGTLRPDQLEQAFEKALGSPLYHFRKSVLEQQQLEQSVPPALLQALSGRSAKSL